MRSPTRMPAGQDVGPEAAAARPTTDAGMGEDSRWLQGLHSGP
jgi:hypothetical protein